MQKIFDQIVVVELAVTVAGPAAAGILSDWGATVIKVEPHGGDPQRDVMKAMTGMNNLGSPAFDMDNRGKKSIELNLKKKEDLQIMHHLLSKADVFITNYRQSKLKKFGLDGETLSTNYPSLIVGIITGYGLKGPDANAAAYDVGAFWARSGLGFSITPEGQYPIRTASGVGDHMTAISLVSGISAALFSRERTKKGQIVETSLFKTGAYSNGWPATQALQFGRTKASESHFKSTNPLLNVYKSKDNFYFYILGLESERHFKPTLMSLKLDSLYNDSRFNTAFARLKNCEELIRIFDQVFAQENIDHWAKEFKAHGVWFALFQTPLEVVNDPQAIAAGLYTKVPIHPRRQLPKDIKDLPPTFELQVSTPVYFSQYSTTPTQPAPMLDEHRNEILHWIQSPSNSLQTAALRSKL